ncbi:MAG: bifunctional UDP-sugar hydrolase/5'-nucleotidase [Bryobacterales bacterium]|nr:bifunctional UDP-sugar hydrolase/5'-nucleotidase [Bryobacterales bacterium]
MLVGPFLRLSLLLLAALAAQCANVEQVTILHLNDLHARLLPDEQGRGGFAHVATAIAAERSKSENAIVLHAGDMVQGSPVSTIFEGTPVFEVANRLGFDAHCLGNHEFDYGWEKIAEFQRVTDAPILAANVLNAQGERLVPPTAVLTAGDLRIGVVGALTAGLARLIKPAQAGPWRATPLVESLREPVAEMNARADLVVVLGHLFDDEDEAILRGVRDVDVLVGGHDHGGRDTELLIDGRIGVKLRPYGRELGRLEIAFDRDAGKIVQHRWQRIPISQDRFPAKPDVAALVDQWESKVSELVDVEIAQCVRALGRDDVKELIERALLETTGAQVAFMNRGGVRDSLREGTVMARHIWNILPFDNALVVATVRGDRLPEEVRAGHDLEPGRMYSFVTNDYVAGLPEFAGIDFTARELTLRDAVLNWVKARARVP